MKEKNKDIIKRLMWVRKHNGLIEEYKDMQSWLKLCKYKTEAEMLSAEFDKELTRLENIIKETMTKEK